MEAKRVKTTDEKVRDGDYILLRLPGDVYRRMLGFLPYTQQVGLMVCSSGLRKATGHAIPRAGFSGPLSKLAELVPGVKDLAWAPQGEVDLSELRLVRLRSLKLLHMNGLTFSVATGGLGTEVLGDLEHLEVDVRKSRYKPEAMKVLDRSLTEMLTCLSPLPRLKSLDLQSFSGLTWPGTASLLFPTLASAAASSSRLAPTTPFPRLEHLVLKLNNDGLLGLLSALEDPTALPALKWVELGISGKVKLLDAVKAMSTRPTEEGCRLLRLPGVRFQVTNMLTREHTSAKVADLWLPRTSLATRQSALLLGAFGPHTEDKRAFIGVIQLLQDPARTISKAAVLTGLDRLIRSQSAFLGDALKHNVPAIVDGVMPDICSDPDPSSLMAHRVKLDLMVELHALLSRRTSDRFKRESVLSAIWTELLSRPAVLHALLSSFRRTGIPLCTAQALVNASILRQVPTDLLRFTLDDAPGAEEAARADLLGLVDFLRYRDTGSMVRRVVNLRVLGCLLETAPRHITLQVLCARFSPVVSMAATSYSIHGRQTWASLTREAILHPMTKLLPLVEEMDDGWQRIKQMVMSDTTGMSFAVLAGAFCLRPNLRQQLLGDDDMPTMAERMMDAAVEATWHRGAESFQACPALCLLMDDEGFATWLRDRYSEVDITAVLLSIRYKHPSAIDVVWRALGDGHANDPEAKLQAMLRCAQARRHDEPPGQGAREELVARALIFMMGGDSWSRNVEYSRLEFALSSECGGPLLDLIVHCIVHGGDDVYKARLLHKGLISLASAPLDNRRRLHRPICTVAAFCWQSLEQARRDDTPESEHHCDVLRVRAHQSLEAILDLDQSEAAGEDLARCLWELRHEYPLAISDFIDTKDTDFRRPTRPTVFKKLAELQVEEQRRLTAEGGGASVSAGGGVAEDDGGKKEEKETEEEEVEDGDDDDDEEEDESAAGSSDYSLDDAVDDADVEYDEEEELGLDAVDRGEHLWAAHLSGLGDDEQRVFMQDEPGGEGGEEEEEKEEAEVNACEFWLGV